MWTSPIMYIWSSLLHAPNRTILAAPHVYLDGKKRLRVAAVTEWLQKESWGGPGGRRSEYHAVGFLTPELDVKSCVYVCAPWRERDRANGGEMGEGEKELMLIVSLVYLGTISIWQELLVSSLKWSPTFHMKRGLTGTSLWKTKVKSMKRNLSYILSNGL